MDLFSLHLPTGGVIKSIAIDNGIWDPLIIRPPPPSFQSFRLWGRGRGEGGAPETWPDFHHFSLRFFMIPRRKTLEHISTLEKASNHFN